MTVQRPRLLIVCHSPTETLRQIVADVQSGAQYYDQSQLDIQVLAALDGSADSLRSAQGYIFITPANIGYMSGALKHFFDLTYNTALDQVSNRPYACVVRGNTDTTGACKSIHTVARGLQLRRAYDDLSILGPVTDSVREQCYELGATIATILVEHSG